MKPFLWINICLLAVLCLQMDVIHIDQSRQLPSNLPDGSELYPFQSLASAFRVINSTTELILMGEDYSVEEIESYYISYEITSKIVITIKAQNSFVLKFKKNGKISCYKNQSDSTPSDIMFNIAGINIEAEEDLTSESLFGGNCNFNFQVSFIDPVKLIFKDIHMVQLQTNFLSIEYGTSLELKNLTLETFTSNFIVTTGQNFEKSTGTLLFDSVWLKAPKTETKVISLYNYQSIELKNCSFENIGLQGHATISDTFKIRGSLMKNGLIRLGLFMKILIEDSILSNSTLFGLYNQSSGFTNPLQIIFDNFTLANTTQSTNGSISFVGNSSMDLNILIKDSKFYQNNASSNLNINFMCISSGNGVAVFSQFRNLSILVINSRFQLNTANSGGVMRFEIIQSIIVDFAKNIFELNNVVTNGGVLSFKSLTQIQINIKNDIYKQNNAQNGAIMSIEVLAGKANINISNSRFFFNKASKEGGVIYVAQKKTEIYLLLENNIYDSNSALNGGITSFEAQSKIQVDMKNEVYMNNTASGIGGVMKIPLKAIGADLNIRNSIFVSNKANRGGVFYSESGLVININSQKNGFYSNYAKDIGAIFLIIIPNHIQIVLKNDIYAYNKVGASSIIGVYDFGVEADVNISSCSFLSNFIDLASNSGEIIRMTATTIPNRVPNFLKMRLENNIFSSSLSPTGLFGLNEDCLLELVSNNNIFVSNIATISAPVFSVNAFYFFDFGRETANINIAHSIFFSNIGYTGGVVWGYTKFINLTSEYNVFFSNDALTKGGVFFFELHDTKLEINIYKSILQKNKAEQGAIMYFPYVQESIVKIFGSKLISNDATQGGGFYSENSNVILILENNLFESNSGLLEGLFQFTNPSKVQIDMKSSIFSQNKATLGGIIAVQNHKYALINISIANSSFISNIAQKGGVLYVENGDSTFNIFFEANYYKLNSVTFGGVCYIESSGINMIIKNDTYMNNTAKNGGGVIQLQSPTSQPLSNIYIVISDSQFISNIAARSGGVLAVSQIQASNFTLINSKFSHNTVRFRSGGVLYFESVKKDTIINFVSNTFEYNSAPTGGVVGVKWLDQLQIASLNNSYQFNTANKGAVMAIDNINGQNSGYNLEALIKDCRFSNNQALSNFLVTLSLRLLDKGGAFSFLKLANSSVKITNSFFISNSATNGGAFYLQEMQNSSMTLVNNRFESNQGYQGGVINFMSTIGMQVDLEQNYYLSNSATFGAVGYVIESIISLKDTQSNFISNFAESEGGAWSINAKSSTTFNFENITFSDTFAKLRGGCLYYSNSSMNLTNVTFNNCSTSENGSSGGALFVATGSITQANNLSFINNQAEYGASIYLSSLEKERKQEFVDISFRYNLESSKITIQNQIYSDKVGSLVLKDIKIPQLNTPLLFYGEGGLEIENISANNMKCAVNTSSFGSCLFSIGSNNSNTIFTLKNLFAQNISSAVPLILSQKASLDFENISISNVESTAETSIGLFKQSNIFIDFINLFNISSNFLEANTESVLHIANSIFDNQEKIDNLTLKNSIQFIVLSESTIQIESTRFCSNSPNFPEKGGAIKLSSPKSFKLDNVTFIGNRAISGGALYIESNNMNGIISNSQFINNFVPNNLSGVPGFGGAIYLQRSSIFISNSSRILQEQPKLAIKDTIFEENIAFTGGAIYSFEIGLNLQNDTLNHNQALSGGGLALNIMDPSLFINILQSQFMNNIGVLYGASILQLRRNSIQNMTGTTFTNETQKFTRSFPAKLKIRTFDVHQNQELSLDMNLTELERDNNITLELDSFLNKTVKISDIKSGEALNKLVEISIYDEKNNHLTELNDGQASLKILNVIYPQDSSKNFSYMIGNTQKGLVNGSVMFYQEINFYAFPKTIFEVGVSMSITHRNFGNIEYQLNESFQVQLSECVVGNIFSQETLICDPCKSGYFSLTDPFSTSFCQNCDTNKADCPGGSIIYPKPGYWRLGVLSDNLIECPFSGACLGGKSTKSEVEIYNLTGFCNEIDGYEGNACATCKTGFAKLKVKDNNQCTKCTENNIYYLKFFGLLTLQILVIVFNIYSNLRSPRTNSAFEEEERMKENFTIVQGTVTKVLIDYIQIFGMIASIGIEWPTMFQTFGSIFSKAVPTSKDVFTIDCFFSFVQGSNENIFFYKLLILNLQPFVFCLFGALYWVFVTLVIKKANLYHNSQFKNNLLVTICLIAYLLQPDIVKNTLQIYKCKNLGTLESTQNFLEQDLMVKCGESGHLKWALGLGVPALIFWLGVPTLIFIWILLSIKNFNHGQTLERYHFVFMRYKKNLIYWDLVIFSRKTAFIFILVFFNDIYLQVSLSLFVCMFSYHLQLYKRPYKDNLDVANHPKINVNLNNLEALGLINNSVLLYGGLFFIKNYEFGVVHGFLMIAILLLNLLFFIRVIKAFYWVLLIKAKMLLKKKKSKSISGLIRIQSTSS